jgi:hypothetical protein
MHAIFHICHYQAACYSAHKNKITNSGIKFQCYNAINLLIKLMNMTLEHRLQVKNLVHAWTSFLFWLLFSLPSWKHSMKCLEDQVACPTQKITVCLKYIFYNYSRVREDCGTGGYNSPSLSFFDFFFWFPSQNTQWNDRKTSKLVSFIYCELDSLSNQLAGGRGTASVATAWLITVSRPNCADQWLKLAKPLTSHKPWFSFGLATAQSQKG